MTKIPQYSNGELGDLSLIDFAILDFTNDGVIGDPESPERSEDEAAKQEAYLTWKKAGCPLLSIAEQEAMYFNALHRVRSRREPIILTTKAVYLWPATIAQILLHSESAEINADTVVSAYRSSLFARQNEARRHYAKYAAHDGYHPECEELHLHGLHDDFCRALGFEQIIRDAQNSAENSYSKLINTGYIEDPVFTTVLGFSLSVVGFIPYGFTKKTRQGRTVHRKITSLFWQYEYTMKKEEVTSRLDFKLWRILRAFKSAIAQGMEETVESPRDNPDNRPKSG